MRELFLEKSNPCFHTHIWALRSDAAKYVATIAELEKTGAMTDVSGAVKAKVLAALHTCCQHEAIPNFLRHCEATDIVKALTLLDRPRMARQLRQKIQQIENQHPHLIVTNSEEEDTASEGESSDDEPTEEAPKKRKAKRKIDLYRRDLKVIDAELKSRQGQSAWGNEHDDAIQLDTAVQEQIESTSVSGALARKVRAWAKENLKADFLEFVLLSLPTNPWRKLADLVHFTPNDFALPYFLAGVFGKEIPQDSFVARMRSLATITDSKELTSAFLSLAEQYPAQVRRQYSYLRNQPRLLEQPAIAECLAKTIPLETLLWYFEELYKSSRDCASILQERLQKEENALAESLQSNKSKATYGKLVERILMCGRMSVKARTSVLKQIAEDLIPMADRRLGELREIHSSKAKELRVAVFGDASASMQAAIEAATIFASMVSTCLDGELSFFNGRVIPSPVAKPRNVRETLRVCNQIRANNCTSLAAALLPYYQKGKVMDLFVMVSDEEENTRCGGYMFAELFAKYKEEVNPIAQLIVVSVGSGDRSFRSSLAHHGIDYKTVTIDYSRPDLTKFDGLLGQLAAMSTKVAVEDDTSSTDAEEERSSSAESDEFVLVGDAEHS